MYICAVVKGSKALMRVDWHDCVTNAQRDKEQLNRTPKSPKGPDGHPAIVCYILGISLCGRIEL